ncbi:MAG: OmpA family protein [Proteobacteria bacterium]|nr:OmpA family protein [Pseudomonadota bacterium]
MNDPFCPASRRAWLTPVIAATAVLVAAVLGLYASDLKSQLALTTSEHTRIRAELVSARRQNTEVQERLSRLDAQLEQEKSAHDAAEMRASESELKLKDQETELSELREDRHEVMKQLAEFKALTRQFQRMIDSGKLEVVFRRGRMVVKMPAAVLFPSGSDELSKDGRQAVRQVARVLRRDKTRRFTVGGHTDTVPIRNEEFKSNWELSTARAVTVTEVLIDSGMRAPNLVAAGFAQYDPVASNKTKRGRHRNRRIEIVLEPYLRKLRAVDKQDRTSRHRGRHAKKRRT